MPSKVCQPPQPARQELGLGKLREYYFSRFPVILTRIIEISYSRYSGPANMSWVAMSGVGVKMAAAMRINTMA